MSRARNALLGLAIGDALGMPTQSMSRAHIAHRYGHIDTIRDADPDQPIAANMPAGSVTDDTEQALLLADIIITGNGRVDALAFAEALRSWEDDMRARGSLDLLGPSTKAALVELSRGVPPEQSGRFGTTNGAAMRITPVAIAVPPGEQLISTVVEASCPTHNTNLALSAAAAVAATVSAGIEGATFAEALEYGFDAANTAAQLGYWSAGASIVAKARWALRTTANLNDAEVADIVVDVIGTSVSSQESVVAAIVLAAHYADRPYAALCEAASLGGDTDTIAAIAGAMLGATSEIPPAPDDVVDRILEVSRISIDDRVEALLKIRRRIINHN